MNFNEFQIEAINHLNGPCAVISVPGSGKTTVITERTVNLIENHKIDPSRIILLTFTNKASKEMKERISKRLEDFDIEKMYVGTFHAYAAKMLRIYNGGTYLKKNFSIIDSNDQENIIKTIGKELNIKIDQKELGVITTIINNSKENVNSLDNYGNEIKTLIKRAIKKKSIELMESTIVKICDDYQKSIEDNNQIDFSGLMFEFAKLLKTRESVLNVLQKSHDYMMVDETQDTNSIQFYIVDKLTEKHNNVLIVGDINQSIYKFRNARYENVSDFIKNRKGCRLIELQYNYRSTKQIVDAAFKLIKHNKTNIVKEFRTVNGNGEKVSIENLKDNYEEASYIADIIYNNKNKTKYSDYCVLYRCSHLSRSVEEELLKLNIPYEVVDGLSFYQREEVKDSVNFIKLCTDNNNVLAFKRLIKLFKGVGDVTYQKIVKYAKDNECTLLESFANYNKKKDLPYINNFIKIVSECKDQTMFGMIEKFAKDVEYFQFIETTYKGEYFKINDKKQNISELMSVVNEEHIRLMSIEDFLTNVALFGHKNETNDEDNKVKLMTIHSAKGLEFGTVFIVGCEEGIMPHSFAMRAENVDEEVEEERRILYVGMTRAKKKLHMTYCNERTSWGNKNLCFPSRFLSEIDKNFENRFNISNKLRDSLLNEEEEDDLEW